MVLFAGKPASKTVKKPSMLTLNAKQRAAAARVYREATERKAADAKKAAARKRTTGVKPATLAQRPAYKAPSVGPAKKPNQTGSSVMKPVTTKTPLITRAPTPSGVNAKTTKTPMIKPTTKLPSAGGQTAAQVAYAAKYRRARELENKAAQVRGKNVPNTGPKGSIKSPTPVGGATVPGKAAAPAKAPAQTELQKKTLQADQLKAYMAKASSAVQAELAPALNELTRQIVSLQQRGQKATNETKDFGAKAESDLTELFGRLGNFTTQVQNTNNTAYEGLKSGTNANYEQLQAALGQRFDGAQAAAQAENARLGLTGTANAPIEGMERDQQFLQGLAQTDQQAALSGLGNSQQGFNQLMGMASQSAQAGGAHMIGQARNQTQKTLADIMFEMNQGITNVEGQRGDIEMTRGEKIRQLAEAMADKDYNRRMEEQQMSFEQRLAQARFNLDKQQVEASMVPQAASYEDQLRVAKLEQDLAYEAARQQKAQNDTLLMEAIRKSGFGPAFR